MKIFKKYTFPIIFLILNHVLWGFDQMGIQLSRFPQQGPHEPISYMIFGIASLIPFVITTLYIINRHYVIIENEIIDAEIIDSDTSFYAFVDVQILYKYGNEIIKKHKIIANRILKESENYNRKIKIAIYPGNQTEFVVLERYEYNKH